MHSNSTLLFHLAQAEGPAPPGLLSSGWIPILAIGLIFWFVVIAPERKQRNLRDKMLANLKKGDKVLTSGGLMGQVTQVQDKVVTLQVADGVRLRFARSAIQSIQSESSKPDDEQENAS